MIYFIAKSQSLEQYETWCSKKLAWIKFGRPIFYHTIEEAVTAFKTLSDDDRTKSEIRGHDYHARFLASKYSKPDNFKLRPSDIDTQDDFETLMEKYLG